MNNRLNKYCETAFGSNVLYSNLGSLSKVKKFTGRLKQLIVRISLEKLKCIVTPLYSLREQRVAFGIHQKKVSTRCAGLPGLMEQSGDGEHLESAVRTSNRHVAEFTVG